jgi:hypothetical protein
MLKSVGRRKDCKKVRKRAKNCIALPKEKFTRNSSI